MEPEPANEGARRYGNVRGSSTAQESNGFAVRQLTQNAPDTAPTGVRRQQQQLPWQQRHHKQQHGLTAGL